MSNVYQISPRLHAPYTMQGAVSVERQVTKSATVSATYLNSRGFDQFLTINANAPFPGTPCPQSGCAAPAGVPGCGSLTGGNVYRYVSEGNFKQNQLILNTNMRIGAKSPAVRFLHFWLRQQRYFRRFQLSLEFLRHQPGLGPSLVRCSSPALSRRQHCLAVSDSSQSLHGGPIRCAFLHHVADRRERRFSDQRSSGVILRHLPRRHEPAGHYLLHAARKFRCIWCWKACAHQLGNWPGPLRAELATHQNFRTWAEDQIHRRQSRPRWIPWPRWWWRRSPRRSTVWRRRWL